MCIRDRLRAEAEALFAGIVLDTKNFTMRTGGRTFEAAALLRRAEMCIRDRVFIMGHKHADFDAVGAAAGVCCIARKRGKKAQIVIDMDDNAAGPILKRLAALPEYKDAFISGSDAFIKAQPGACLLYTSCVTTGKRPVLEISFCGTFICELSI